VSLLLVEVVVDQIFSHISSDRVAYAVLRGERSYVDWFPYKRYPLKRAKAFLLVADHLVNLTNSQIQAFENFNIIRIALSHGNPFLESLRIL
jgi:hypothetical protein